MRTRGFAVDEEGVHAHAEGDEVEACVKLASSESAKVIEREKVYVP